MLPPALPAFVGLLLVVHEVCLWDCPEAHSHIVPRWLRLLLAAGAFFFGAHEALGVML